MARKSAKSNKERKPSRRRTSKSRVPAASTQKGPIAFTPLTMLATVLKCVLKDKITDREVERICSSYYKAIQTIWDDDDEEEE
jgi:hypothetical protein